GAEMVRRLAEERQPVRVVAAAFGVSERTVRKWAARAYQAAGLQDRSCRPHRSTRATPPAVVAPITALTQVAAPAARIAPAVARSRATVGRVLRRLGLERLRRLAPA